MIKDQQVLTTQPENTPMFIIKDLRHVCDLIGESFPIRHYSDIKKAHRHSVLSSVKDQIPSLLKESESLHEFQDVLKAIHSQIWSYVANCILFGDLVDADGVPISRPQFVDPKEDYALTPEEYTLTPIEQLLKENGDTMLMYLNLMETILHSTFNNSPETRAQFDEWSSDIRLGEIIDSLERLLKNADMSCLLPLLELTSGILPPQNYITGRADTHWYRTLLHLETTFSGKASPLLVRQLATAQDNEYSNFGEVLNYQGTERIAKTHLSLRFSHIFQQELLNLPPYPQKAIESAFTSRKTITVEETQESFEVPLLQVVDSHDHLVDQYGSNHDDEITIRFEPDPIWNEYLRSLLQLGLSIEEIATELAMISYGDDRLSTKFSRFLSLNDEENTIRFRHLYGRSLTQYVQQELIGPFLRLYNLLSDPDFREAFKANAQKKQLLGE